MVGALSMVGSSLIDSHTGPCLCLDSLPSANIISQSTTTIKKHISKKPRSNLELSSSFTDSWQGWKVSTMAVSRRKQSRKNKKFVVVNELGGQYEDNFEDVKNALVNYFTYKAVRTVMHQLYELNPSHYGWFYEFVRTNKPGGDGKRFIRALQKERHDLAERVMITRLHLYGKWVKKCNHAEIYNSISDDNLGLMRERLLETVIWPSDDSSSEMIS